MEITTISHTMGDDDEVLSHSARLVQSIGMIISNTRKGFWLSDSDRDNGINECFAALETVIGESEENITFNIIGETVTVNEETVDSLDHLIQTFISHLTSLEISSFMILRNISREEFGELVKILDMSPEELEGQNGFSEALLSAGVKDVHEIKVKYERVAEGETVISESELETATAGMSGGEIASMVVSLLKKQGGDDENTIQIVTEMAADPNKMAGLILQAAGKGEQDEDLPPPIPGAAPVTAELQPENVEDEDDAVIDGLRRTFDLLMKNPSTKTQKGKKALSATLSKLEKEMLSQLGSDEARTTGEAVSDAINVMLDELKMETIASEYVKKRKAIEESERRILRYMKSKGLDKIAESDFEEKLSEIGLDKEGWSDLISKSGEGGLGGGVTFSSLSLDNVSSLLDHLEESIQKAEGGAEISPEAIKGELTRVDNEIAGMAAGTQQKIDSFITDIVSDMDTIKEMEEKASQEGKAPRITRKMILTMLTEIVQELCQPISVVNCSIDMISSKSIGEVTDMQNDMLKLAKENLERMGTLVNELNKISGVTEAGQ